jgi:hypothetical protein
MALTIFTIVVIIGKIDRGNGKPPVCLFRPKETSGTAK